MSSEGYSDAPIDVRSVSALDEEAIVPRYKKQALQSMSLSGGFLADIGSKQLSSQFLEASIGSGIPLGTFDNILGIRPSVRVDWIDADDSIGAPEELYEFQLQFFYRKKLRENLSVLAIISPSMRSDLSTSNRAFRLFALGLFNWQCIPRKLTISAGVVSLGRSDLPVLPALGLSWTPTRRTKLDLRFPSSKFAYRLRKESSNSETWAYSLLGLGGNTWAVTRNVGGTDDTMTDEFSLRDIRFVFGLERIVSGGGGWFAEAGYTFSRRLEFEHDPVELNLGDAILLQAGWRY